MQPRSIFVVEQSWPLAKGENGATVERVYSLQRDALVPRSKRVPE